MPWSVFMVIEAKAPNMTTTVQPEVHLQDACVSVSFPFNSMIEDITTWALALSSSPKTPKFLAPKALGIFVLPLLKHSFWMFLLLCDVGLSLWTLTDLCEGPFTFPYIFHDAMQSAHLLPHCGLAAWPEHTSCRWSYLHSQLPPKRRASGSPCSPRHNDYISFGSPSCVNASVNLHATWIGLSVFVSLCWADW